MDAYVGVDIFKIREQKVPMPPTVLPWLTEGDYPRLQSLIPELQKVTYAEWADDHRRAMLYRQSRNGSVDIPVSPEAFDAWAREAGQAIHLELLWIYAEAKAASGQYR